MENKVLDAVVIFSSNYDVAPINYVTPSTLTEDLLQPMFGLALTG